jgi:mxaA protein
MIWLGRVFRLVDRAGAATGVLLLSVCLGQEVAAAEAAASANATNSPAISTGQPRLLRFQPPRDTAHHLGDVVVYRALVEWPPGWELDTDSLQGPVREDGPLELRGHSVETAERDCRDCRWLNLRWQIFKAVRITADVSLPVMPVRWRNGAQVVTLRLPGAPLSVSPLVPWERRTDWADSARPGWQPLPLAVRPRLWEAGAWLLLAVSALLGWAWSSGRWLPRPQARPFAAAWRAVRARRLPAGETAERVLAEDLRSWHRAFDATAGEAVFAEHLDAFFARQPHLAPLAEEVRQVFAVSLEAFYLAGPPLSAPRLARQDLVALLGRLAEHEFRLVAPRRAARESPLADAPV